MTKKLIDKVALVTGASRGIGRAVAKKYAKEGAHVIITARDAVALEQTDDEIQNLGGTSTIVPLDMREHDKIDQLCGSIYERFRRLDIVVGNAAQLGHLSPMHQIDPKTWDKTVALNLTANFRLLRSVDPLLRMSENGRAIYVTSSVAQNDSPYWGGYAVTKAALEKMIKTYALEVQQTKIRVNLIDPGQTDTSMLVEAMPGKDLSDVKKPDEITDLFVKLAEDSFNDNGMVFKAD